MTPRKDKLRSKWLKELLKELPYFNFRGDQTACHGPLDNTLFDSSKTKKSLDKLSSLYDFGLFNTNTRPDDDGLDLNNNLLNCGVESSYFSPHNFQKMKSKLTRDEINCSF